MTTLTWYLRYLLTMAARRKLMQTFVDGMMSDEISREGDRKNKLVPSEERALPENLLKDELHQETNSEPYSGEQAVNADMLLTPFKIRSRTATDDLAAGDIEASKAALRPDNLDEPGVAFMRRSTDEYWLRTRL